MNSVGRILLVLFLLFVIFPLFFDSYTNPFYVGNRNNARRAACASNMKQLGLALLEYSQDSDNALPSAATADGHGWREAIYPYTKSTGLYRCPDDTRDDNHYPSDNLPKSYNANHIGMGADHAERGLFAGVNEPSSVVSDKTIANPALIVFVVDTRGYEGEEWNIVSPAFLPNTGRELYAHIPRHIFYEHPPGLLNLLFADDHVKALKPMATISPVNLWTRDNAPFTGQEVQNAQAVLKHAEDE